MDIDLSQALETQLLSELSDYGISCSIRQATLLIHHLLLVIEKNKVMNLTRITDPQDAVTLHVVDSLLPLASRMSLLAPELRYVDIGTGAGFPGIPWGAVRRLRGSRRAPRALPFLLLHMAAPVYLLGAPPLLTGMRWRDFASYYPDQTLVLLACCILLLVGGLGGLPGMARTTGRGSGARGDGGAGGARGAGDAR